VASKTLGGWLGAFFGGLTAKEGLAAGVILNGRGVTDLVVAEIALSRGYIGQEIFSALVILSIFSTLIAPTLYKRLKLSTRNAT